MAAPLAINALIDTQTALFFVPSYVTYFMYFYIILAISLKCLKCDNIVVE